MRSCHLYVEICGRRLNVRVGDDDHDVGVGGELIDEGRELLVLHLHRHELSLALAAAQLELLDDVADLQGVKIKSRAGTPQHNIEAR